MTSLQSFLTNGVRTPPASRIEIEQLRSTFQGVLPEDYFDLLAYSNGFEGFVGSTYLRLYSTDQVILLNHAYQFPRFVPGLVLFGSNGGGEAFAFDTSKPAPEILQIPFIPLSQQVANRISKTMLEFLTHFGESEDQPKPHQINPETFGLEIHEIQPIIFGGNPTDFKNKVLLKPHEHAAVCIFWNDLYLKLTGETQMEGHS